MPYDVFLLCVLLFQKGNHQHVSAPVIPQKWQCCRHSGDYFGNVTEQQRAQQSENDRPRAKSTKWQSALLRGVRNEHYSIHHDGFHLRQCANNHIPDEDGRLERKEQMWEPQMRSASHFSRGLQLRLPSAREMFVAKCRHLDLNLLEKEFTSVRDWWTLNDARGASRR